MRRSWALIVAASLVLISGAGIAAAQKALPKPYVPTVPAIPVIPVTPVTPVIPAIPTIPTTPAFPTTPNLTPVPVAPAPVAPVDPCRTTNPPSYCRETASADGGGDDSCSQAERSCSSTATACLQTGGVSGYYYVGDKNGRPTVYRRVDNNPDWARESMNACWSRLNSCLSDRGC